MIAQYNTNVVPPPDRLGFWQEMVHESYVGVEIQQNSAQEFFGSIDIESLDLVDISELRSCGQYVTRTPEAIAKSERNFYLVLVQLEGSGLIYQDTNKTTLDIGSWALVDTIRPYQFAFNQQFKQLVISIPRNKLPVLADCSPYVTGQNLRERLLLGDIVSNYLSSLLVKVGSIEPESRMLLAESVLNLICAALIETIPEHQLSEGRTDVYREIIKAFIRRNLQEPELSVGMIAKELRFSKRYVHKLFNSMDMTISEYIRRMRLENCRRELVSERNRNRNITEIAFSWGFNSAAHFSYLFRQHYRMSATEYRQQYMTDKDDHK